MARVRARDTKPEALLKRLLRARGLRYRLHLRVDGCQPDLVFKGARLAVFVDGCFWNACPDYYVPPRTRDRFWREKLLTNVERDVRQTRELEERGRGYVASGSTKPSRTRWGQRTLSRQH